METLYFEKDTTLDAILTHRIAIIGYGNQGRAQALNLRDSGLNVVIALRDNSKSIKLAKNDGFECIGISQAVRECDILSMLTPDQSMAEMYDEHINRYLKPGKVLLFSHGYNIHYQEIVPPHFVDVIMVAPSGPGYSVRKEYVEGRGVPTLIAVKQDITGKAKDVAISYSKAIGGTRSCCFESTFKQETETDLFGEQIILTGIIPKIINESFKVLLEAGYSPTVSWFVTFYEVRQIAELLSKTGIEEFYKAVSDTAEYGGMSLSNKLVNDDFKSEIKSALDFIQSGDFHREWKKESDSDYPRLSKLRSEQSNSPINEVTKKMLDILSKKDDN